MDSGIKTDGILRYWRNYILSLTFLTPVVVGTITHNCEVTMKHKAIVKSFETGETIDFPVESEMYEAVLDVVYNYAGRVSAAAALGILDLIKHEIKNPVICDCEGE